MVRRPPFRAKPDPDVIPISETRDERLIDRLEARTPLGHVTDTVPGAERSGGKFAAKDFANECAQHECLQFA